jgi:hypothetical protein
MKQCRDCENTRGSVDYEIVSPNGDKYDANYCKRFQAYVLKRRAACDEFKEYLEPCPFCGEKENLMERGTQWIRCRSCEALGPDSTGKMSPTEAWNRRTK